MSPAASRVRRSVGRGLSSKQRDRRSLMQQLRRLLSRSRWLAHLLNLPESEGDPQRPGLLILQIDGLSRAELERALARGEMPFLRRLQRREGYRLHTHYSGLPSTTPAVQAELFYGVQCAVPAFAFREHDTGRLVRMYEPGAAAHSEAQHDAEGRVGLLAGGSAYADTVTGGAAEAHFCPSALGWGPALRAANPLALVAFLLSNLYSFVRVAVLLLLELGLALVDFVRGLYAGEDLVKELKFVPTRVAISILLRELCTIGGKIDLARGLPVVHINFLGYDEQSHRRGPRSLFAHWTLKGIDDAVSRLWHAARGSPWRRYQVWLYSDHGQVAVRSYAAVQGYSLEAAVYASLRHLDRHSLRLPPGVRESIQTQRVRFLGGVRLQRLFGVFGVDLPTDDGKVPHITSLGPVGHVYLPDGLDGTAREATAHQLAQRHAVPLVLFVGEDGRLHALCVDGEFELPRDRSRLFGESHPFIDDIGDDLVRLCNHPDAGDLVLLGWRHGLEPITFATENGAHGGASPQETRGFALLPGNAPLVTHGRDYLRPLVLREAALSALQGADGSSASARPGAGAGCGTQEGSP